MISARLQMRDKSVIESTGKVNQRSKDVTQTQQKIPELPTVTLTWNANKYKALKLCQKYVLIQSWISLHMSQIVSVTDSQLRHE